MKKMFCLTRIAIGATTFFSTFLLVFSSFFFTNNVWKAVFLGFVQGFTEWLPISSSGHLVIIQHFINVKMPLSFDVALHVGTLSSVFWFFRKDIAKIFSRLIKLDFKSYEGKLACYVIWGTLPLLIIGFVFHDFVAKLFTNLFVVGISLLITGAMLYPVKFTNNEKLLDGKKAFLIGLAQSVALIPGISRSGFTLSVGCRLGLNRETAFKFSFLMAIPAIIASSIFEFLTQTPSEMDLVVTGIGMVVASVVGYLSIKVFNKIMLKNRLNLFAYYCFIVGFVTLVFNFI
ncbi:MAG: undecaprenyl-diphosphate phosphatase [Candidatus Bathyarchaeota archaeon]|nr:MAG: undecaprenyl-diphosphate phosphatase [Candidatus Bathyarchaeota archaeon]